VSYSRSKAGPKGSRRLRFSDFKTISRWKWLGCQTTAPATFTPPPRNIPGNYFCQKLSWLQGHRITKSGIEPATSRLVSQCLTNCATACSRIREAPCSNLVQINRHHWYNSITTVHRDVPGVNPDMKTGCSDRFYVFTLSLSTYTGALRRVPANRSRLLRLYPSKFITHYNSQVTKLQPPSWESVV